MDKERVQSGNEGEELVPGVTENLSSANHQRENERLAHADGTERPERGAPPEIDRRTGEVHGSGANAGGGGTAREDYDQDTAGGGTKPPVQPGGGGR